MCRCTTLVVTINPIVMPDFDTTLTLCNGATAPVLATTSPNGISGTWNPALIDNSINDAYTFTPNANQCATTTTLAVTINPIVTPDFDTTLTLCNGATAPVLATTSPNGISGIWNPAVIDNSKNGTYTFTPNANQCAATTTLVVTINPIVTPDFDTTLTLCNGATAPVLATTSPNGIFGTWSPAVIDNSKNDTYTFTPNTNQCAATTTLVVTINPIITPDFDTTLTLCNGGTAPVLSTTSPNGISGTWNPAVIDNTTNGSYTFTPNANQCAATTTLVVTINPIVTPDFDTTLTLCNGATAPVLATTSPNGISGIWNPAVIDNTTNGSYTFTPNANQCAATTTLVVTINRIVTPDFDTTLTLCNEGTAPILATTSPNGISGTWSSAVIDNSKNGTYTFTPNTNQCATSTTLAVTITSFKYSITQDCIDNNYLIKIIQDSNIPTSDYTYSWINDKGDLVGNNSATFNFTEYIGQINDKPILSSQFKVIVGNESCEVEDTFEITNTLCGVPNAISPNDDGINDNFDLTTFNVNTITIFNRWGKELYHFEGNYVNQWHGQWSEGNKLPSGTYYYIISSENGDQKAGWIFLTY